jgi:hypothetical protein
MYLCKYRAAMSQRAKRPNHNKEETKKGGENKGKKETKVKDRRKKRDRKEEGQEEVEVEDFLRITNERKVKKGKSELQLLWADGTTSWVAREVLEGQDALEEWDNQEPEEPEIVCSQQELEEKVATLAKWILAEASEKRFIVFHVGAGMSAGDGFRLFEGPAVFGLVDVRTLPTLTLPECDQVFSIKP